MPTFTYEALDSRGRVVSGSVEAPDAQSVVRDLRNSRYTVTSIREKKDSLKTLRMLVRRFEGVSLYALAIFTRQFAVLFNSGISTVRGLEGLARQSLNARLTQAIQAVYDDIRGGYSLAKAMTRHPDVFSPVYISMVKAGEMSGAMGEILDRLATFLERELTLQKKVAAATTYPTVVFIACVTVTFILVTYVFPTFIDLFEGLDVRLPWITRSLIWITNTIRNPLVMLPFLAATGAAIYSVLQYFKTPWGRRQKDRIVLDMPVLGILMKKVSLSRFCRTLGTLLGSGVPMVHALEIVAKAAGNVVISDVIEEVQMGLKAGMRLSQPLKEYRLFPPMLAQMVSIGEETGNLPLMLNKLADFYDLEVEHALESLTSMLEPIMILFMGIAVGYVLLAVFIPVYDLVGQF
ncbi:MAG: type II secretion system F family protein [Candidatus Xenobium sp.]|jgi:type IV pilus assembly protein PilC|nr:type II secretion system F family protein [Burkholderiales bacterium]